MHIGYDISVLRIAQAGVLVYVRSLLEQLIAQGQHQWTLLDVLPLNPERPMQADMNRLDRPGVHIVRCPGLRRTYMSMQPWAQTGRRHQIASRLDQLLDRPWALAATAAMGLQLRSALRNVDLFHSSDQFLYAPPNAAAVLTIHDLTTLVHPEFHAAPNTTMHSTKDRFAREQADHIIAVSQSTKRDIVRYLNIPAERITVVHEGADTSRFQPYSREAVQPTLERYGLTHQHYMLSIGTLEPRKNYVRLLEAYATLRQQCAAEDLPVPPLVIAGGYGWLYEEITAAPARLGIAAYVHILGKVPDADLPLLLAGAQMFVYPSLYEGFGLPVLEALQSGVPVVASSSTSIPEVLGEAGIYCVPTDVDSIAQGMHQILSNPALAAQLRQAGPQQAAQFSWQRAAREVLDVYREVVARRAADGRHAGGR